MWLCGVWLLVTSPGLAQTIRYVRQGGSGNGTSWAAASGDIQKMIDVSGVNEVWVAQGTYKPATGNNPDRTIGFVMKNGVTIYGGFPATGNPSQTDRKPTVYTTILSGDIDNDGSLANNSYHVVFNRLNNLDNTAILDGFTVTAGNASDSSPTTGFGGGIYNENSSPQIINCLIRNNYAAASGGGMINIRNLAVIINCTFQGNAAGTFGGGMYTLTSNLLVINSLFRGNTAQSGGGLYLNTTTSAQLANCTFASHSTASNFGNAIVTTGNSSTQLLNCIAWNNGGAHTFDGSSSVQTTYSLFEPTVVNHTSSDNIITSTLPFTSSAEQTLRPCSPAINAGSPNSGGIVASSPTDVAGNPRLYEGRIDMGAFEYQSSINPTITQQPVSSTTVQVGTTVTASVSITGTVSSYQWYKNGNAVTGQMSATLTLPSVTLGDAGSYSLVVTGCTTTVTSTAFNVVVTQPIRYVRQSSSGLGDGSSWANASSNLQGQIDAPGVEQVWVAAGTYKPTSTADRNTSFAMKNNVAIYGGFPPTGTPTLANRRTSSNPTILSGEIGGSGTDDNSYHVLFNNNNGLTNSAILDGFVITAGNATGSDPNNNGGGMLNIVSSPQLRNCIFASNTATFGGALYSYNSSSTPLLVNCSFQFNSGVQGGGALFSNGSSPQFINCTFVGNTGTGGAIANLNGQPQLINCVLFDNGGSSSLINASGGSVTARYSLFETSITNYSGTNNLTTTSSPFASTGSAVLNSCSSAINAGDPASTTATNGTLDVAGNSRFYNNGRIDMGAFEYQGAQSQPVFITAQPRNSTVPAGSTVTTSVSVTGTVSNYQWYRNGSAVSGQTSATLTLSNVQASDAGEYRVVIVSPCNSVTSTVFTLVVNTVPDLTPTIYARPTSLTGPKLISVVVESNELNGIPTSGLITLKLTRDASLPLSLSTSATNVGGRSVDNSVWQLNLDDPAYYVLTTNQTIAGDGVLAVGLTGTLNPGGTTGTLTISSVLVNIPGETRRGNNTDADKIEYFP